MYIYIYIDPSDVSRVMLPRSQALRQKHGTHCHGCLEVTDHCGQTPMFNLQVFRPHQEMRQLHRSNNKIGNPEM